MSDTWIQQANRAKIRANNKTAFPNGPFLGSVNVVNKDNETMDVEFQSGLKQVRVLHPFVGISSWIRAIPDSGMSTLMQLRYDTNDPETIMYYNEQSIPKQRIDRYNSDNPLEPYRPLYPGEIHAASRGGAENFFGRLPYQETRAGILKTWLDQTNAEVGAKAPLHVWRLHQHSESSNTLGDEMRFGIVKRPKPDAVGSYEWPIATDDGGGFAKEYVRILKKGDKGGKPPFLIDHREGHVSDDQGKPIKGSIVTNPLLSRWIANGPKNEDITFEVDNEGNMGLKIPAGASVGMKIEVEQTDMSIKLGRTFTLNAKDSFKVENALTEFKTSNKTIIDCGNINLGGSSPTDKVIKGSTYRQKETQLHSKLLSALTMLSTQLGIAGAAFTAAGAAMVIPIAGPIAAAPVVATAGTALITSVTAVTQMISAIVSFETASGSYLSETTKVK